MIYATYSIRFGVFLKKEAGGKDKQKKNIGPPDMTRVARMKPNKKLSCVHTLEQAVDIGCLGYKALCRLNDAIKKRKALYLFHDPTHVISVNVALLETKTREAIFYVSAMPEPLFFAGLEKFTTFLQLRSVLVRCDFCYNNVVRQHASMCVCRVMRYCDRQCQKAHYKEHKSLCKKIRVLPKGKDMRCKKQQMYNPITDLI